MQEVPFFCLNISFQHGNSLKESQEDPEYSKVDIMPYLKYAIKVLLNYKSDGSIEHNYEMNMGATGGGRQGGGVYALEEADLEGDTNNGSAIRGSNGAEGDTLELFKVVNNQVGAVSPPIDATADVVSKRSVKNSRKVFNTSSKIHNGIDMTSDASLNVVGNNPSIRKVVNRSSSTSFSASNSETGYRASNDVQTDTAENGNDDTMWSAPATNSVKKTWFG